MPSASYSINGKTIERSGNTTILDTGTTLLLVDDTVLKTIYGIYFTLLDVNIVILTLSY